MLIWSHPSMPQHCFCFLAKGPNPHTQLTIAWFCPLLCCSHNYRLSVPQTGHAPSCYLHICPTPHLQSPFSPASVPIYMLPTPQNRHAAKSSWVSPISGVTSYLSEWSFHWCVLLDYKPCRGWNPGLDLLTSVFSEFREMPHASRHFTNTC